MPSASSFFASFRFVDVYKRQVPAFAVDAQSLFLQGAQNIFPVPDKSPRHFFLEESMDNLFGPVAVAFPDFLAPFRHSRLEQVSFFRKLVPCPCRVVGPRPAFAPVEQDVYKRQVLVRAAALMTTAWSG